MSSLKLFMWWLEKGTIWGPQNVHCKFHGNENSWDRGSFNDVMTCVADEHQVILEALPCCFFSIGQTQCWQNPSSAVEPTSGVLQITQNSFQTVKYINTNRHKGVCSQEVICSIYSCSVKRNILEGKGLHKRRDSATGIGDYAQHHWFQWKLKIHLHFERIKLLIKVTGCGLECPMHLEMS